MFTLEGLDQEGGSVQELTMRSSAESVKWQLRDKRWSLLGSGKCIKKLGLEKGFEAREGSSLNY